MLCTLSKKTRDSSLFKLENDIVVIYCMDDDDMILIADAITAFLAVIESIDQDISLYLHINNQNLDNYISNIVRIHMIKNIPKINDKLLLYIEYGDIIFND